jgi:16S rRNA G1207 methylase RsmC
MKTILVINALNGVFPLVLQKKYPTAKITCAEIFPFYKHHLRNLGFEVMDWDQVTDMKFDLVLGNPPYQLTNSKKIWPDFINKSLTLLNPQGLV